MGMRNTTGPNTSSKAGEAQKKNKIKKAGRNKVGGEEE